VLSRAPVRLRPEPNAALAGAAVSGFLLLLVAGAFTFGMAGLVVPLLAAVALVLLRYPGATLAIAMAAVILCEGDDFGLLPQTAKLYATLFKGFMPIDAIVLLAVAGLAIRLLADRRPVVLPSAPLAFTSLLLGLGLISGILVGRQAGVSTTHAVFSIHTFVYVALLPFLLVNLDLDRRKVLAILWAAMGLATAKALIGLMAMAAGRGPKVNGTTSLTYYAPTANWLMTVALLTVAAALILRSTRVRLWMTASAPLLLLCLVLSYRRSFWVADAIGLVLVLLLGFSTAGRRLALPLLAVLGVGVYLLGGVAVQSDTPLAQRAQTLSPTNVAVRSDDRYRLDERANVIAELRRHPVSGLGLEVPWTASARSLPIEANPDHLYVHFAALFWWLKLGILGLLAYVGLVASAAWLALRVWRRAADPLLRAFGLGSLCSVVGLIAIEGTATFTGSDVRFTMLLAAQIGLLAVIDQQAVRD
jgi:O-antigen ligase